MSDGDSSSSLMIDKTYEKDVTNSLIPIIEESLNEFKKIFADSKQKTAFANNIWQHQQRRDDYRVENVMNFDQQSWNRNSPEQMREMVQLYYDQATVAKREAALNAERNLNLQSRLTTSELTNKRLVDILEGMEPKMIELLQKAAENEIIRIEATREFKDAHDRLEYETQTLTKELANVQKGSNEFASSCQKLQHEIFEKNAELNKLRLRADISERDLDSLKTKLSDAVKNGRDTQTSLNKAQQQINRLENELDSEKRKIQQRAELYQRECEKVAYDKDLALERQKKAFEKEIEQLRTEYDRNIREHKRSAQEAIARSSKEASDAVESAKKYHKLYTELHSNLELHKKEYEQKIFAKLMNGYRNFANDFNDEQVKGIRSQNNVRFVPAPTATNKFSEKCLDILQSSASSSTTSSENGYPRRDENAAPPPIRSQRPTQSQQQQQQARNGIRQVARSYSVTGRFPAKR